MLLSALINGSKDPSSKTLYWQLLMPIPEGNGYIQLDIASAEVKDGKLMLKHTACSVKDSMETGAGKESQDFIAGESEITDVETWMNPYGLWYAGQDAFLVPAGNKHWVE